MPLAGTCLRQQWSGDGNARPTMLGDGGMWGGRGCMVETTTTTEDDDDNYHWQSLI